MVKERPYEHWTTSKLGKHREYIEEELIKRAFIDDSLVGNFEKESGRKDQTSKLGKPLSMGELQIYYLIHSAGAVPVTVDELYEQHYGCNINDYRDRYHIYMKITRIRQKLGEHSIIKHQRPNGKMGGYISRRALIEENFSNSKPSL